MKMITVFCAMNVVVFGTTIQIPTDYTTIQEGIDASTNGDTLLIAQGIYYENLILEKEIVIASHAIYDDLESGWLDNEHINETIINGVSNPTDPNKGSCLIIRNDNIAPTIIGLTFQDGIGTSMTVDNNCSSKKERSGGAILIYQAYPNLSFNRFLNNGGGQFIGDEDIPSVLIGGAISHYDSEDVEFDEDRNNASQSNNSSRDVPDEINIQNNYFEGNSSGNGENFYSYGYEGSINVSGSVFENIDCESSSVNEFVLHSVENEANYIQNEISGTCIESNSFYISNDGDDNYEGTESAPFKTIGHALTVVRDSETVTTINLASGVYSPLSNGEQFPIVLPDNVHLIGANTENTILDAGADETAESAVIIIKEVENVVLANLTLTGGYTESHGCTGGGGLLITANDMFNLFDGDGGTGLDVISTPLIENVIIENNHSHNGGGLSFFRTHGSVLNNVIIRNNVATAFGGGVFCYGGGITMTNVTVTGNQNLGDGQGGGMMLAGTEGTLDSMTITNNTANGSHGGGIWTNSSGDDELGWVMTNSFISGNHSDMLGGGITFAWSHPTVINTVISENSAWWGGGGISGINSGFTLDGSTVSDNFSYGGGGGIFAFGPLEGVDPPVIEGCMITRNETGDSDGGGILLNDDLDAVISRTFVVNNHASGNVGGIDVTGTSATINNVTVTGNTSDGGGIGITNANVDITNSIVWDNTGIEVWVYSGSATVTYSDIEGGFGGEGNIDADPLFTDPDNGDYTLQSPDSPCIDAGTADTDGDGEEDITYAGLAPDIGAFESILSAPTNFQLVPLDTYVILTWNPILDDNFQYYIIDRSTDPEFATNVVTQYAVYNYFQDNNLEYDIEYFYRLSYYSSSWSEYSEVLSVTLGWMDINANELPITYALHENYPNPFNPVTNISYDLPEEAMVNITIFDMMGRVVKTLVNRTQTAGFKSLQWNATNNSGHPVSAGVYIYSIQAGSFNETRKMILLK